MKGPLEMVGRGAIGVASGRGQKENYEGANGVGRGGARGVARRRPIMRYD